jgi:hypothetical protein
MPCYPINPADEINPRDERRSMANAAGRIIASGSTKAALLEFCESTTGQEPRRTGSIIMLTVISTLPKGEVSA